MSDKEKEPKKPAEKKASSKANKSKNLDAVESKDSGYHGEEQQVKENLSDADAYASHPKFQKFKN